jgi:hypothetical protein
MNATTTQPFGTSSARARRAESQPQDLIAGRPSDASVRWRTAARGRVPHAPLPRGCAPLVRFSVLFACGSREEHAKPHPKPAATTRRLLALSRAYNLLTENNWRGAHIREVVEMTTAPYGRAAQIEVVGGEIHLPSKHTLALTANAAGALHKRREIRILVGPRRTASHPLALP